MEPVTREFSTGEILGKGFSLFWRQFPRIVIPLFFGAIITALGRLVFAYQTAPLYQQLATFRNVTVTETNAGAILSIAGQLLSYAVLQVLVLFIVSILFFAIAFKVAYDSSNEMTPNLKEAFSTGLRRFPSLLFAGIAVGCIVTIGIVLLIVPGVIFTLMFLMFLPAIVVENEPGLGSLGRSRQLTSHRWGVVFLVMLVALIVSIALSTVFGDLLDYLFGTLNIYASSIVQPFYGLISDVLGVSLLAILYKSLLIKEGGEPNRQAQSLTHPDSAQGPAPNS